MPKLPINENHRRALASSLDLVEALLSDFVRMVHQLQSSGSERLSPQTLQQILQKIEPARQQIRRIRERFDIPLKQRTDPVWAIQVGVGRIWEILEDCKAEKLRGYGEVPEPTRPRLNQEIQQLIDLTQEIAAAAKGKNYPSS